jgi:pimeloyl-ACP methyl ester carboxylesterase
MYKILFPVILLLSIQGLGQQLHSFEVTNGEGQILPAHVIDGGHGSRLVLLFINGSTPYDEQGNIGVVWRDDCQMLPEPHDLYQRFLDVMPGKGHSVATMAKRSFVYPCKLPRPGLDDLASDLLYFIGRLKEKQFILDEGDLVVVGYSEGSIVAAKLVAMMQKPPAGLLLLGSASLEIDCSTEAADDFYMVDVLDRISGMEDYQIIKEKQKLCLLKQQLQGLDEQQFEESWKQQNSFAPWESLSISREVMSYNPLADISKRDIPVLFVAAGNDMVMPALLSHRTYESLKEAGMSKVSFRDIPGEVHQYITYEIFAIAHAWISSEFRSLHYVLSPVDFYYMDKYVTSLIREKIHSIPFGGGYAEKIISCYNQAVNSNIADPSLWFGLGLKLLADTFTAEAFDCFSRANVPEFLPRYAALVWMGSIKELGGESQLALEYYHQALREYPGVPVRHDNWQLVLDQEYILSRIENLKPEK